MAIFNPRLVKVATKHPEYAYEAYDFIFKALEHAQAALTPKAPAAAKAEDAEARPDITSAELLDAIRTLALQEFGRMARIVFNMWGVRATADFGRIVNYLMDAGLMNRADADTLAEFEDAFDFDEALVQAYAIPMDEVR